MTNRKMMMGAVLVAFVMMAVPFIGIADDSDATSSATGTYSVYTYDGSTWVNETVGAYDAAQAVKAMSVWQSTDSMTEKYYTGSSGYVTYQPEVYGDITTFRGVSADTDNVWNVFVYVNSAWTAATVALGNYTCYSDQPTDYQTANICLYYGAETTTVPADLANQTLAQSSITEVDESDAFKFTFYIKIEQAGYAGTVTGEYVNEDDETIISATLLASGVSFNAYGSNAALALYNYLVSTDLSIEMNVPGTYSYGYYTYMGWINTMFGLGTVQTAGTSTPNDWTDDTYAYWQIYDTYSVFGDSSNHLADFVLGAFSAMSSSPNADSDIALIFKEYSFSTS